MFSSPNTLHWSAHNLPPAPPSSTQAPEQHLAASSRRRREDSTDYAEVVEIPCDYSSVSNHRSYEISRNEIDLEEMLGVGQFGDVFRGVFTRRSGERCDVAVKTCKLDTELSMADKFLAEARRMEEFNHPHIIQLIGVCSEPPVYIVMELASFGELRTYLREHESVLSVSRLVTYCHQIGLALSYLHFKKCVHRDVAARNVLMTSGDCCKLADFGLSRWVDDQTYYTASKGKMPIKWMAPESINFRKFTHQSDVWMYGVCMWEILTFGQKPFPGVDNAEIIGRIERGERLPLPDGCPMTVYNLMVACWAYSPSQRPTFHDLTLQLKFISSDLDSPSSGKPQMMRGGGTLKQRTYSCDLLMLDEAPPKPCRSYNNLITTSTSDLLSSNQCSSRPTNERQGRSSTIPRRHSNVTSAHTELMGLEGAACWDVTRPGTYLQDSYEARLIQQQYESEKDKSWLNEQERSKTAKSSGSEKVRHSSAPASTSDPTGNTVIPAVGTVVLRAVTERSESLEQIVLDRGNDAVYEATTRVLRAIIDMTMTRNINETNVVDYITDVKKIGVELRTLLTSVDALLPTLPANTREEIEMAHSILGSDMSRLVHSVKLALEYNKTLLNVEYRKGMLREANVLAVDSRNLLDAVDIARKRLIKDSHIP